MIIKIYILIFPLLLFSCGDTVVEVVIEKYSNGIHKTVHFYDSKVGNQELVKVLTYF